MQFIGQRLVLSPSDLVGFLACQHLTELSFEVLKGTLDRPTGEGGPEVEILRRRGLEHESRYLEVLTDAGLCVEVISDTDILEARVAHTDDAIRSGVDVIYQAAFLDESGDGPAWVGFADFLHRVDVPSELGPFSYEPEDAKLARRAKPGAVIQLCAYAEQLERLQGRTPENIHVKLGSGERESLRMADYGAYYRTAKRRFQEAIAGGVLAYPEPVEHCAVCQWRVPCDDRRLADDHLSLVPGLRRDHRRKLAEAAGIETVAALADFAGAPVKGISDPTVEKLQRQARLLVRSRANPGSAPSYEVLGPAEVGKGLGALPAPTAGDVFFDIESDPFIGDGLEYLFGLGWVEADDRFEYRALWSHSLQEERGNFEALVDFLMERLASVPDMHVYHYASYERGALGRLMGRHGTREDEVDSLLRGGALVDLLHVVRQSMCIGVPSYSLKKVEGLYMPARTEAITDGGSSIAEYERWLEEQDPQILQEIERYNRVDCDSTRLLRDFLESLRGEYRALYGSDPPRPPIGQADAPEAVAVAASENLSLKTQLAASSEREPAGATGAKVLLGDLLDWYRREAKPQWWKYFERVLHSDEQDLYEDTEAIAGLVYEGVHRTEARSYVHRYCFDPAQEHKLAPGQSVADPAVERRRLLDGEKLSGPGTLLSLDSSLGVLDLKRGINSTADHPRSLIPGGPIATVEQRDALRRLAEAVVRDGVDDPGPYRAARDLLLRRPPRTNPPKPAGQLRVPGEDALTATTRLSCGLTHGALAVQGPPGSGKTYSAASVIVTLIDQGATVGVTANSHAAITNLLEAVMDCATERGTEVHASQKADDDKALDHPCVEVRQNVSQIIADLDSGTKLVAGTAWLFAHHGFDRRLDYLVVEEAGQLSLANVLAVSTSARNVILVGDPRQLAQPSQGTHPEGAGASGLDHLLGAAKTMPEDLGVFMEHTRRLHPSICRFVSEVVYEGRLESLPGCEYQAISGEGLVSGSGLRWVPVVHAENRVSSIEEVRVVAELFDALMGRRWVDRERTEHGVGLEDVLVVAPYNAQVALLREALPSGARIGTVDKFQGQQAPVVIVSLATSSAQELPRGIDFLYSRNRLNVAVSRAQALSVMVGSPELLSADCSSVAQLALVNGLCRYVELAEAGHKQLGGRKQSNS